MCEDGVHTTSEHGARFSKKPLVSHHKSQISHVRSQSTIQDKQVQQSAVQQHRAVHLSRVLQHKLLLNSPVHQQMRHCSVQEASLVVAFVTGMSRAC